MVPVSIKFRVMVTMSVMFKDMVTLSIRFRAKFGCAVLKFLIRETVIYRLWFSFRNNCGGGQGKTG